MAKPDESQLGAGNKKPLIVWLREQTRRDATVYMTAAVFMAVSGLFATVATFIFVFLVLLGILCGLDLFAWIPFLLALPVMAGLWYWHLKFDRPAEQIIRADAGSRGVITLRLTPLTGTSWLMFLDRPAENLNPVVRFVTNVLLLAPRLCSLAWRMASLSRTCQARDFPMIAAGLDRLMEGGRFPIGGLLEDFPEADPQRFIDELTGIEGVIFLPGDDASLTLVPSFYEEFEEWQRERRRKKRSAEY